MLVGGEFNDENPLKGMRSVPVIVDIGEEDYLGEMERPGGGENSMMINP